jgi:hypothetical protein
MADLFYRSYCLPSEQRAESFAKAISHRFTGQGVNRLDVLTLPSATDAMGCDADRRRDPAPNNSDARN